MIINLPGDLLEFGVFKGGSLIQFATFRKLLENERSRKIVGFDVFGEFPRSNHCKSDENFVNNWNKSFSRDFLSKEDLELSLEKKNIANVELIKGDILETIDIYFHQYPATRISLLHIDTDVYEPAKIILEKCYNRVVSGGIIVFDDYGVIEGETLAVDEFFSDKILSLKKFSFSHAKPSYIIK